MALTAAPVPGNTILSTWGTEIRNRTMQVFSSTTERDAWNAPNGSRAVVLGATASGHDQTEYMRVLGAWVLAGNYQNGTDTRTTSIDGILTISHSLGTIPTTCLFQPFANPSTFGFVQLTERTTTQVKVKCFRTDGTVLTGVDCTIQWALFK
jgi:hypothetical protein